MHLCGAEELLPAVCSSEHQKQLRKQQASRVAAQRSRQRHTDRADALHQQYEMLEKHNHALRREIQALQAELGRWSRTLRAHECLCHADPDAHAPPVPPDCWTQAKQGPGPHGQHCSGEQPGLFPPPPVSTAPHLQPHGAPSLLLAASASLTLNPAVPTPPPVQLTLPSSAGQLSPFPELSALLPCPAAPPQPPGQKQPVRVRPGTPFSPSLALELAVGQGQQTVSAATGGLGEEPSPAFPLLASAQVRL